VLVLVLVVVLVLVLVLVVVLVLVLVPHRRRYFSQLLSEGPRHCTYTTL
jgi:hypothetical protein